MKPLFGLLLAVITCVWGCSTPATPTVGPESQSGAAGAVQTPSPGQQDASSAPAQPQSPPPSTAVQAPSTGAKAATSAPPAAPPTTSPPGTAPASAPGSTQSPPPGSADGAPPKPEPPRSPLKMSPEQLQKFREAQALLFKAEEARRDGDVDSALNYIDQASRVLPGHIPAAVAAAKIHRSRHRYDEALLVLEAALATKPEHETLLCEKALTLFESGQSTAAEGVLTQIFNQGRKAPEARYLLAIIHASGKDREKTYAALEAALEAGFAEPNRLAEDGFFDFIRNDQRFTDLVDGLRYRLEAAARADDEDGGMAYGKQITEATAPLDPEAVKQLESNLRSGRSTELRLTMTGADGKPMSLADHAGKAALVEFLGTWSELSTGEIKNLARLRTEFDESDLAIILCAYERDISSEVAVRRVAAYLREAKVDLPWTVVDRRALRSSGIDQLPCTVLVGRDGKAYMSAVGSKEYAILADLVRVLLAESR